MSYPKLSDPSPSLSVWSLYPCSFGFALWTVSFWTVPFASCLMDITKWNGAGKKQRGQNVTLLSIGIKSWLANKRITIEWFLPIIFREFVRKACFGGKKCTFFAKKLIIVLIVKYFARMLRKLQFTFPERVIFISYADQKLSTWQGKMDNFHTKNDGSTIFCFWSL